MKRPLLIAGSLAAVATLAAPVLGASERNVNLLTAAKPQIAKINAKTSVPVLLPRSVPLVGVGKVYPDWGAGPKSWLLILSLARNCGGANACFSATFEATRGKALPAKSNARLANGDRAWYRRSTCGANCSPWSLSFVHAGVLYSWQIKQLPPQNTKAIILRLANEAVAAGPR